MLIDHRDKPFELGSDFQWVEITLNEPNVSFNDGPNILDPVLLRLFMFLHATSSEVLDVLADHVPLDVVGWILFGFSEVIVYQLQERTEFAVLDCQLEAILLDYFLFWFYWCNFKNELIFAHFDESVIFGHESSFNSDFLDSFSVGCGNIGRVVTSGALLVAEIKKAVRLVVSEDEFFDSIINFAEFLLMGRPVCTEQEKLSQSLLGTFRDKLWVTERLEITAVVQECRKVNVDLLELHFC